MLGDGRYHRGRRRPLAVAARGTSRLARSARRGAPGWNFRVDDDRQHLDLVGPPTGCLAARLDGVRQYRVSTGPTEPQPRDSVPPGRPHAAVNPANATRPPSAGRQTVPRRRFTHRGHTAQAYTDGTPTHPDADRAQRRNPRNFAFALASAGPSAIGRPRDDPLLRNNISRRQSIRLRRGGLNFQFNNYGGAVRQRQRRAEAQEARHQHANSDAADGQRPACRVRWAAHARQGGDLDASSCPRVRHGLSTACGRPHQRSCLGHTQQAGGASPTVVARGHAKPCDTDRRPRHRTYALNRHDGVGIRQQRTAPIGFHTLDLPVDQRRRCRTASAPAGPRPRGRSTGARQPHGFDSNIYNAEARGNQRAMLYVN